MAQVQVQDVINRFQAELGVLHGQLIMGQMQIQAEVEEREKSEKELRDRISNLEDLLTQNNVSFDHLPGVFETEGGQALAEKLAGRT